MLPSNISWYPSSITATENERDNADYVKDKLNKTLFNKMQAIEAKRAKEKEQEKVNQKLSKAEKKKQEFEQKMKQKVFNFLNLLDILLILFFRILTRCM